MTATKPIKIQLNQDNFTSSASDVGCGAGFGGCCCTTGAGVSSDKRSADGGFGLVVAGTTGAIVGADC